jgi:hypothetical protein
MRTKYSRYMDVWLERALVGKACFIRQGRLPEPSPTLPGERELMAVIWDSMLSPGDARESDLVALEEAPRDAAEVQATKNAAALSLPIFVILPGTPSVRSAGPSPHRHAPVSRFLDSVWSLTRVRRPERDGGPGARPSKFRHGIATSKTTSL